MPEQFQYLKNLFSIISEAFQRKIDVGVHVPTYPQFRDMIGQFLDIIKDEKTVLILMY